MSDVRLDRSELAGLADRVRRCGRNAGLDEVGIAPAAPFVDTLRHLEERKAEGLAAGMQFTYRNPVRSTTPALALSGAAALVVGARRYLRSAPRPAPEADADPAGRIARYSWQDHYAPLRQGLEVVAAELEAAGWRTRVLADDNALVDREAAYRAGLGWYGKNTNLLMPGLGSWYVLGSVVTNAPLPAAEPVADGCGSCARCLPACPTGAFIRPGVLDGRRCLAWLVQAPGVFPREHRVALGDRIYGCDECQEVCPVNLVAAKRHPPPEAEPGDQATTGLLELLAASDAELLDQFGRWYIPHRQPRFLRRNALLALGNVADGTEGPVVAALTKALADPDPIVRGHAVWAAARLGRRDLLGALAGEHDPDVRAEVEAAPQPRSGDPAPMVRG